MAQPKVPKQKASPTARGIPHQFDPTADRKFRRYKYVSREGCPYHSQLPRWSASPVQIPLPTGIQEKLFRTCVVYAPACRKMNAQAGIKSKHAGRESQYQCDVCKVALFAKPCFAYTLEHQIKNVH